MVPAPKMTETGKGFKFGSWDSKPVPKSLPKDTLPGGNCSHIIITWPWYSKGFSQVSYFKTVI
jgi:hypothetical protein